MGSFCKVHIHVIPMLQWVSLKFVNAHILAAFIFNIIFCLLLFLSCLLFCLLFCRSWFSLHGAALYVYYARRVCSFLIVASLLEIVSAVAIDC